MAGSVDRRGFLAALPAAIVASRLLPEAEITSEYVLCEAERNFAMTPAFTATFPTSDWVLREVAAAFGFSPRDSWEDEHLRLSARYVERLYEGPDAS